MNHYAVYVYLITYRSTESDDILGERLIIANDIVGAAKIAYERYDTFGQRDRRGGKIEDYAAPDGGFQMVSSIRDIGFCEFFDDEIEPQ
jgi:hypothetical protein